jgi:hypothetical protein
MGPGNRRLSVNAKVLLVGVLLLFPLFPFLWLIAAKLLGPSLTLIVVLSIECLVSIGLLCTKVHLKGRVAEKEHADFIASALRKAPI